jgi:IS1 family transposase
MATGQLTQCLCRLNVMIFIGDKFQSYEDFMHHLEEASVVNHIGTINIH